MSVYGKSPLLFQLSSDQIILVKQMLGGSRTGSWRKDGDRIQIVLPGEGIGLQSQFVAVGIIKGDKMVLRFAYKALFGSAKGDAVVRQMSRN